MASPQINQVALDPDFHPGLSTVDEYIDNLKVLLGSGHATSPLEPGDSHFGAFSGGVISANSTLKSILQQLADATLERKRDSDNLGTAAATTTVDFVAGDFDNKRLTVSQPITTITLGLPTRDGRYGLYLNSDAAADREINWAFVPGGSLALGNSLPTYLNSTEYLRIELEFVQGSWFVSSVDSVPRTFSATGQTGAWQLDAAGGRSLDWVVSGQFAGVNNMQVPANLPVGKVMTVQFQQALAANIPDFSAFKTMGGRPAFTGQVDLTIMRWQTGYHICGIDHGGW